MKKLIENLKLKRQDLNEQLDEVSKQIANAKLKMYEQKGFVKGADILVNSSWYGGKKDTPAIIIEVLTNNHCLDSIPWIKYCMFNKNGELSKIVKIGYPDDWELLK